jgi:AcrR family transcriptional regulator
MTASAPAKLQKRATRNAQKRSEKKAMIAESAQQALQELGYANTSLRDIAAKADLSLGMLHYYFEDKAELITYCVSAYKADFTALVENALQGVSDREAVIARFADALAESIYQDAATHRLWYDIRNQALFDPAFRTSVMEIEETLIQVVSRAWCLAGRDADAFSALHYSVVDGVFRYLMQRQMAGESRDQQALSAEIRSVLDSLF